MMNKTAILVFQKNEVPGKVKTRLAAKIGDEAALQVYRILIDHTHRVIEHLEADRFIFYSDSIPEKMENTGFYLEVQSGKDLGERMKNAFELVLNKGYEKCLIIGTDCAALEANHIYAAFQKLELVDVVIGPAEDGGYYLLGMKKPTPRLFTAMEWSTAQVFEETVKRIIKDELTYSTIPILSDIDELEDWEKVKERFKPIHLK